ncbi:MAG: hypothetical protein DA330_09060, partial [Nitrososphaera sp.]|nr:hypothetical protein [Nitrososphaera sp.]
IAHIKYIQHRPGEDRERGGREMFNDREDSIHAREMREAIKELGNSQVVVHKLMLSPEVNVEDKKAFTREVMENMSREMGRDLEWFAVQHNNTDHHHIHVVVLGKDRNGTEVRISMKDIEKAHEYGNRYLERCHPLELERSRREREDRLKEEREVRDKAREAAREERIREGLELPWLHQKIVREQLEPYKDWKERREELEKKPEGKRQERERPYYQDTIEAAGKRWSKENNLSELRDLNERLWDNYEERIPKDDYKKLASWIREKERQEAQPQKQEKHKDRVRRDEFEYDSNRYRKTDSYEKLTGLSNKLREKEERLPFDDYQRLRGWIEGKDRERFSGALEKQIEFTHKKFERSRTVEDVKAMEGGRVLEPMQEHLMRNPIVGLFMAEAAIANEIVRSIPLDDRNRDYLKERIDGLEDAKRELNERQQTRRGQEDEKQRGWDKNTDFIDAALGKHREEKDRETREKIEKAQEEAKKAKEREDEERKRKRERKRDDWDRFDPWGRF